MSDEFKICRHEQTGEVMDVAVSALPYFPDWRPIDPEPEPPSPSDEAPPAPGEPAAAAAPAKTATSRVKTADQKGDERG